MGRLLVHEAKCVVLSRLNLSLRNRLLVLHAESTKHGALRLLNLLLLLLLLSHVETTEHSLRRCHHLLLSWLRLLLLLHKAKAADRLLLLLWLTGS